MSILVHKFGGAALASDSAILHVAELVAQHATRPTVVVVSALSGVTDSLLTIGAQAAAGNGAGVAEAVSRLQRRHEETARSIVRDSGGSDEASDSHASLEAAGDALRERLEQIRRLGSFPADAADSVMAYGERCAATIVSLALRCRGLGTLVVDGADLVATDGRSGDAAPDLAGTQHRVNERLVPRLSQGAVPVVPGFIGVAPDGRVVTLGRGGSDLTATVLARALGAQDVFLWKDVAGFLTADPRVVEDARVVGRMTAREAAELAYHGATVLHPRALLPIDARTRVYVRPFANPASTGTEITVSASSGGSPVRALSAAGGQAMVTVTGTGLRGAPVVAARTFSALADAGLPVSFITQASSQHSITLTVPEAHVGAARARLVEAFSDDLARGEIESIHVKPGFATLAVVGTGMVRVPGIAARMFATLADHSINIVAIAQGASELNISVVVDGDRVADAQRALHAAFQLDKQRGGRVRRGERIDVILLGFGRIGRELASHVAAPELRSRIRVVGVIDRGGYLFDPQGISDRRLAAAAIAKLRGNGSGSRSVAELPGGTASTVEGAVAAIAGHALAHPVLVDAASGDTSAALAVALDHRMDVVLANKVPLTLDRETSSTLFDRAQRTGRRLLFEATVGAGLPIIDTFDKLVGSGDRVLTIEGCPSGTLGYLFGEMGRGTAFSEAVRRAMSLGYTEPDPRDDLSGLDVARKGLILGRMLGFEGEMDNVKIESLVPSFLQHVQLDEFLRRLEEMDAGWSSRVAEAAARGEMLRYRAIATRRSVRVGLVSVPAGSPLASLAGTDNQFIFTTKRYRENPLVIIGPGAGPAVTAAGVVNDVLKAASGANRPETDRASRR